MRFNESMNSPQIFCIKSFFFFQSWMIIKWWLKLNSVLDGIIDEFWCLKKFWHEKNKTGEKRVIFSRGVLCSGGMAVLVYTEMCRENSVYSANSNYIFISGGSEEGCVWPPVASYPLTRTPHTHTHTHVAWLQTHTALSCEHTSISHKHTRK